MGIPTFLSKDLRWTMTEFPLKNAKIVFCKKEKNSNKENVLERELTNKEWEMPMKTKGSQKNPFGKGSGYFVVLMSVIGTDDFMERYPVLCEHNIKVKDFLQKIHSIVLEKGVSDHKYWERMVEFPKDGNVWWIFQGS